jgi:O-antigen/teichoic acid export membrane protein
MSPPEIASPSTSIPGETAPPVPVGGQVVRGSLWFVVAVGVNAAGGLLYWAVATRLCATEVVSQGGFLYAAVLFVNYVTTMGLPVAVARFGPANDRAADTWFSWALLYTTATSAAGTVAFLVVAEVAFPRGQLDALWAWGVPVGVAVFFTFVVGQSFAVLVETRLVTQRRWGWVLGRVVLVVVLRLPLFVVPALRDNGIGLLVIIAGTPALSGLVGAWALRRTTPAAVRGPLRPLPPGTRLVLRYATVNYLAMLAAMAPQFLFPLIVGRYEPADYGAFYVAWTIVTVVFVVPHTVGQTVVAEGARDPGHVDRQVRLGLAVAVAIVGSLTVGAFVLAGPAVRLLFGDAYDLAADLLPRMVAAAVPWCVTALLIARARVRQDQAATVVVTLGFAGITLALSGWLAATRGLVGAANGWLLGNVVAAGLAVVATAVLARAPRGARPVADLE